MTLKEKDLEETIEEYLTVTSGEYRHGTSDTFNLDYVLDVDTFIEFVSTSQPGQWEEYQAKNGDKSKESLATRLRKEIDNKGLIEVLRSGITDRGFHFAVAYYRPETSFNPDSRHQYDSNILTCVRQFHYSKIDKNNSIDMVLLLNGIAIISIELKNQYTGQSIEDSKEQFMKDRDPSEPFLRFNRNNLVYMCIDTSEACITTRLEKEKTWFMPFNLGSNGPGLKGGKGNPLVEGKYQTYYIWEHVFSKDCLLNIIRNYVHYIKGTKKRSDGTEYVSERILFPRYHQLDVVDRLVEDARENGSGKNYLIEHSAGSGKSNSIAWLAYRLMSLHNIKDQKIFDSIIVITDRRNLDHQLQATISSFDHNASGVVCNVDKNSKQLLDALNSGKKIVVTTLQKFPVIYEDVSVKGKKFAVIVDEAHSSQTGISATKVKEALGDDPDGDEEDFQDKLTRTMKAHGRHGNLSFFAFTATPKPSTLEVFGVEDEDGSYRAYHIYSMRQAIEEGFILNVLQHYATFDTYYKVAKSVEDDPIVGAREGRREITRYVRLHQYNISQKAAIMIDFFRENTLKQLDGRARAMVVTSSRLSAVRYYQAFQKYIKDNGIDDVRTLVAFTGTVQDDKDPEIEYTEEGMNRNSKGQRIKEDQVPEYFKTEFNVLIVADKYQTGFDEPLLQTMFVDKALWGIKAVQTLSRLNRVMPGKHEVYVLDFVNTTDSIKKSFEPYYEDTELEEGIDLNSVYDVYNKILLMNVLNEEEVNAFGDEFYSDKPSSEKLDSLIKPCVLRANALDDDDRTEFRNAIGVYCNRYSYVTQLVRLNDRYMQKLYVFCKNLHPLVEGIKREKYDLDKKVKLTHYKPEDLGVSAIDLIAEPKLKAPTARFLGKTGDEMVLSSELIEAINALHGGELTEIDKIGEQLVNDVKADSRVVDAARRNTEETFFSMYKDSFTDIVMKRMRDNEAFFEILLQNQDIYDRIKEDVLRKVYNECRAGAN